MSSRIPCLIRMAGALWVLAFLIWLPFEDTETWMAFALGVGGCAWLGLRWRAALAQPTTRIGGLATGGVLGAATPALTLALMALKSGLHAHGFGDFTAQQLWAVLSLIPLLSVVGGAAGFVVAALARKN